MSVARLDTVPLQSVWPHEARDLTPWLERNIDLVGDAIDRNLTVVRREQQTESAFRVDLVAEADDDVTVVIENQYGHSDHRHLGQIMTYLATLQARVAVWIVEHPRPEHVTAVAWLNEAQDVEFYLLKLQAFRIGASEPAALLTPIVGPSEVSREVRHTKEERAERHDERQHWWSRLVSHPEVTRHRHITPTTHPFLGASTGVRGINLTYTVTQEQSTAGLYIDRGKGSERLNALIFDRLKEHEAEIEAAFGGEVLDWKPLHERRACRVTVQRPIGYRSPPERWDAGLEDLARTMERMADAFEPHLRALDLDALERLADAEVLEEET